MNQISDYKRIEKAIHYLTTKSEDQPSLQDLSSHLGLSEFHCHRLFKKWAGITPKDFLQVLTLVKAKRLLALSQSVFNVSLDVGLSGSSRLHDLFLRYEAMTPGEYKNGGEGLQIGWSRFASPLGSIAIGATHRGLCSMSFQETDEAALKHLQAQWPRAKFTKNTSHLKGVVPEILSRISGKKTRELSLLVQGTPFQVKVWQALLLIPEGKVSTYQQIAHQVGLPKATRAVGTAIGANPIGYLIPCHRVIRSTGAIGEYHWGSARKTAFLAMECGRAVSPQSDA